MLISKQNRRTIYENLFKEGVMVAKKDYNAPKHDELDVPNLQVIKAMQSLTSKGLVHTQFSWQYYYYTLTPEGLEFLREWYALSFPVFVAKPNMDIDCQAPSPCRDRPRDTQAPRKGSPSRPGPPRG